MLEFKKFQAEEAYTLKVLNFQCTDKTELNYFSEFKLKQDNKEFDIDIFHGTKYKDQEFTVMKDSEFRFYLTLKDSLPMAGEDENSVASTYGCSLAPKQNSGDVISTEIKDDIGVVVATFDYSLNFVQPLTIK